MITAKARPENSLRAPNNTTLHLEREDKDLKTGVYTVYMRLRVTTLQITTGIFLKLGARKTSRGYLKP
jgi:hypothetical protein